MDSPRVTVRDVIDDPTLARDLALIDYESDMRVLAIYQARLERDLDGPPVPKALWRRIVRYRRSLRL